ncbi:transglutaminase family protein [Bauldia sp.]|uniref:transglutaminase family protein n=1 Tax=Bauldia sp. TaxID=2575872 RepID=UPI003BAD85A5
MRLRVHHETVYRYATPATRAIQVLRLTPRGHDGQFVIRWRIDVDQDCRLEATLDPFGDTLHTFTVDGPLDGLSIVATGEVETRDTDGVVRGHVERLPAQVYLRDTALTKPNARIRDLAETVAAYAGPNQIDILHAIMAAIRERLRFEVDLTDTGTSAIEAFDLGHGVCQDFTHIFLAAARHLGIPARYVSGYLYHHDERDDQNAGHAWGEALVDDLGWVAFDPANGICATDAYVRVAVGLDYLGAAPVRGARYGGSDESLSVTVRVAESARMAG